MTDTVADRDMQAQLLDSMDLEKERGITIKLNAVELTYRAEDGRLYLPSDRHTGTRRLHV